jgi:hypothetical protein
MNMKKLKPCVVILAVLMLAASVSAVMIPLNSSAGEESGWGFVVRSELLLGGTVSSPFVFAVDDDSVTIEIDKTFSVSPTKFGIFQPIIIEFQKLSDNAVSKIVINDEHVVNDTGVVWTDYHMFIMNGDILNPRAGFDPQYLPSTDQFEEVGYQRFGEGYNELPILLNFVDTDGEGVNTSPAGDDVFQPGYDSGQIVIETSPEMEVGQRFGLKQVPTVPEPATVLLLTGGMGALIAFKRNA